MIELKVRDFNVLREARLKENKTDAEKLLLHYNTILSYISGTLVDESKCHISKEKALEEIHEAMLKLNESDLILNTDK